MLTSGDSHCSAFRIGTAHHHMARTGTEQRSVVWLIGVLSTPIEQRLIHVANVTLALSVYLQRIHTTDRNQVYYQEAL